MITETLTGEEGDLGSGGITFATLTGLSTLEDRGSEEDTGEGAAVSAARGDSLGAAGGGLDQLQPLSGHVSLLEEHE